MSLISLIIFCPLAAAGIILCIPNSFDKVFKWIALFATGIQLAASIVLLYGFNQNRLADSWGEIFQYVEKKQWILIDLGSLGWLSAEYHVGVDGLSIWLVVLSGLLLFIGVLSSWKVKSRAKGYFFLYLILSCTVVGCFVALDLLLFYVFFEFMLLPMFFLIGIWGGIRRTYASIKFFLFTLLGSLFILVVFIGLYLSVSDTGLSEELSAQTGIEEVVHTFNMVTILDGNYDIDGLLTPNEGFDVGGMPLRYWAFIFLVIGFAIKLPLVPVHTWLPDAHVEAPTAISVLLAGILLKIGGYGLFRVAYSMFPEGAIYFAQHIAIFGLVSIIYGGMNAMAQGDLKRMIAYSSISHMGFVVLGLAALTTEGLNGSMFQMISHGLISAALFLIVGVYYDRTRDRKIENASGLAIRVPNYTFFTALFFFASLGLPGMSGFVGELFVLLGAIGSENSNGLVPSWIGIVAVLGIIISAAYYLWAFQRMFMGRFWLRKPEWEEALHDLTIREWIMLLPLGILVIFLGLFPNVIFDVMSETVHFFADFVLTKGAEYAPK